MRFWVDRLDAGFFEIIEKFRTSPKSSDPWDYGDRECTLLDDTDDSSANEEVNPYSAKLSTQQFLEETDAATKKQLENLHSLIKATPSILLR